MEQPGCRSFAKAGGMMAVEMALLANNLSQLGRDLQDEINILGRMEDDTVTAEGAYRHFKELYEDALARAILGSRQGSAESRKAEARLACVEDRQLMEHANLAWDKKKAELRTQHASLQALHRRCEIGRSLLSREKALVGLELSGIS